MSTGNVYYEYVRMSRERLMDFYSIFSTRGKQFSFKHIQKKYNTFWTGKEFIGTIAYDSKKNPVAHLGALPMFIEYEGKKHLCEQISDAVIHPNHLKKGIFVELINEDIKIAKEEGIEFLYVFPSPQAYSGFIKTGWKETDLVHHYQFETKALPLNKIANKFNLTKLFYYHIKLIGRLISKTKQSEFTNSVLEDHIGGVLRDENFIRHKNYTPNFITQFRGFKIWWKIDDGLSVGDIERFDPQDYEKLLKALKRLCFLFGFQNFKIMTTTNTFLDRIFSMYQTPSKGNKVYFYDISSGLDFSKIKFNQADMNTF